MKSYILSLLAGMLAGAVYHTLGVQSPAPPTVALMGLLGILAGEQMLPIGRLMSSGLKLKAAWCEAQCKQHMFGSLPGQGSDATEKDQRPS
ncbi:XapX domain-containing protein [Burkholderia sp. PU8-34]